MPDITRGDIKTLLNFSGGVDSLAVLYEYAVRREPLLIHFCELINWTKRYRKEVQAVDRIMEWIEANQPFPYEMVRTRFDHGNVRNSQDKYLLGFCTGLVLQDPRWRIKKVIISSNAQDVSRTEYYTTSEAIRLSVIGTVAGYAPEYIYPIKDRNKEQLMRELPRELLDLSWSCRKPIHGKECGNCQACTKIIPVRKKLDQEAES